LRINNEPLKTVLDGYPGLTLTASKIADYIPDCKIYVEPFAGLGRVAKYVKADRYVLNDKSEYAFNFLQSHFTAQITNLDFEECIKLYDSEDTFFLIDPPWRKKDYDKDNSYFDRTVREYYKDVLRIVKKIKGNWIICCDVAERETGGIVKKSGYYKQIVLAKKRFFKTRAKTLMISNKPFKKQGVFQMELK